ncbi:hypothetical protein [Pseudodonghicola sp.]|uniref:hypothetical protein n=1 Tax=Pseudodonghicola sp. TaxID=1969463 RepID=UPI003A96BDD5
MQRHDDRLRALARNLDRGNGKGRLRLIVQRLIGPRVGDTGGRRGRLVNAGQDQELGHVLQAFLIIGLDVAAIHDVDQPLVERRIDPEIGHHRRGEPLEPPLESVHVRDLGHTFDKTLVGHPVPPMAPASALRCDRPGGQALVLVRERLPER